MIFFPLPTADFLWTKTLACHSVCALAGLSVHPGKYFTAKILSSSKQKTTAPGGTILLIGDTPIHHLFPDDTFQYLGCDLSSLSDAQVDFRTLLKALLPRSCRPCYLFTYAPFVFTANLFPKIFTTFATELLTSKQ